MAGKQKRLLVLLTVLVVFFSSIGVILSPSQTYADHPPPCNSGETQGTDASGVAVCKSAQQPSNNNGQTTQSGQQSTPGTTCAVEKIGWIVCPIVEKSAVVGDMLFSFLADNFLQTEPELVSSDENNGTITAWGEARNLANIMFIIAFIIIVYSQVTGAGLNNYGVKKMLPKLIVAAILVNISYYICQVMVDASNILGYQIKNGLVDLANTVSAQHVLSQTDLGTDTQTGDGSLALLAQGILATAALVWLFIGLSWPIFGLVIITCIVIIIILLLRKAIIVLLIVVSPIAFVAYLLPNTEKFFSKWLSMFWQLLMVFPIVAMLFGGGQLASSIILAAGMKSAKDPNSSVSYSVKGEGCVALNNTNGVGSGTNTTAGSSTNPDDCAGGKGGPGWMLALVAAGIAIAPLLAVWAVLKGALAAAGAIGGKISGAVQKGTSGAVSGGGKWAGDKYDKSAVGQMRARDKKMREIDIKAGTYSGRGGKFNPRNARSGLNRGLNNLDNVPGLNKDEKGNPTGFIGKNLANYTGQRDRMAAKDEAEYLRGKAQDAIAQDTYLSDHDSALEKLSGLTEAQLGTSKGQAIKRDNEQKLKYSRMAIGSQLGAAGMERSNQQIQAALAGKDVANKDKGGGLTGGIGQAAARQATSQSSGGGIPGTSGPSNTQAARLSFNSTNAAGGVMSSRSGRDILGQMYAAGGADKVAAEDLVQAVKHAEQHLSAGGEDVGHTELGTQAVEALAKQGLDHEGRNLNRPPGGTS
jgi:hypothetical protein